MSRFPDRRYFARVANETGFRAEPLETVFRLARFLGEISLDHGEELSLRGGTALNLLHLDVPRLSVDVDLDFVGSADAAEAQQRRPELLAELETLGRSAGYEIAHERPSYAMAHLRLGYRDASDRPAFLKLDLNFLDRVPVLPTEYRPLRHPFGEDLAAFEVQTLALAELAAGKTIALVRRSLARDLFDTAMLSALRDLDVGRMRTVLVVRGASYPPPSPADYSLDVVDRVPTASWRSEVLALCRRPVPVTLEESAYAGDWPPPSGDGPGAGAPRVSRLPRAWRTAGRRTARSESPRTRRRQPRPSLAPARRSRGARGAIAGSPAVRDCDDVRDYLRMSGMTIEDFRQLPAYRLAPRRQPWQREL